jgi:hypothetical protein
MSCLLKVFIALAPIASLANCSEGSCMEDETSLMQTQVKIKAHQKQEQPTETQTQTVTETQTETVYESAPDIETNMYNPVEMNQSYYKAAYLNTSIAKYAAARAKHNRLKARYNEMQASFKTEGKDFANTEAGRSLIKAMVFADNEMAAWKLAGDAYNRSGEALQEYEDDYMGKQAALYNITAQKDNATAELAKAQDNYTNVKKAAQKEVDRAAAKYSAKLAYDARVAAAAAIASYKNATKQAKAAQEAADLANKAAEKQKKLAVNEGLAAAKGSSKTVKQLQKAEAAKVDQQLAGSAQIGQGMFSWADNVR